MDPSPTIESAKSIGELLFEAAYFNLSTATDLLAAGAPVDHRDPSGQTPSMIAAKNSRLDFDCLRELLAGGADLGARSGDGLGLAAYAALNFDPAALKMLIDAGADIDSPDNHGWTPLMHALNYRHRECAKLLLLSGARPEPVNASGDCALSLAQANGLDDCAALVEASLLRRSCQGAASGASTHPPRI